MRGPATPQRGCASAKALSFTTASGSGTASGLASSTKSPVGLGDAAVRVRGETMRPVVDEHANRHRDVVDAARHVRDHDELVHLREERRERFAQFGRATVRDDDRRDARHRASTSR